MSSETESIQHEKLEPNISQLDKVIDSLDLLVNMQADRITTEQKAFESIDNQLAFLRETVAELKTDRQQDRPVDNSPTGYEAFKKSLFDECGTSAPGEEKTLAVQESKPELEILASPNQEMDLNQSQLEEQIDFSNVPMTEEDAAEIEEIKRNLRKKLRDAEVEFSIKRARLMHKQAEIEEREAQYSRVQRLNKKYAGDADRPDPHMGILGRLNQHLRRIKTTDSQASDDKEIEAEETDESADRQSDDQPNR